MYKELEKKIHISFQDSHLLKTALTHRSYINEHKNEGIDHNERLEFLGDAVLELIITEYLYYTYPTAEEGALTSMRSALVRKENLAFVARKLHLGKYLLLNRGEEKSGGREKDYLLANTCEALLGAVYLDRGMDACRGFIKAFIIPRMKTILAKQLHIDAKSALQEFTQERLKITPSYKVIQDSGPDHDKTFITGVFLREKLISKGKGSSKRKAEEEAARKALAKMRKINTD